MSERDTADTGEFSFYAPEASDTLELELRAEDLKLLDDRGSRVQTKEKGFDPYDTGIVPAVKFAERLRQKRRGH